MKWTVGGFPYKIVGRERFINYLYNCEQHLSCKQIPSDNHIKSENVDLDWNPQGALADCSKSILPATPSALQFGLEIPELTEPPSTFDFYALTPEAIQTARVKHAPPVILG